ncbi:MAG: hypothetical protein ACOVQK_04000, partial [Cyanobium sp.]
MADLISPALAHNLNFLHPVMMWGLLGLAGYSMVLGLKAKKTRTADAEERKQLEELREMTLDT